MSDGLSSSLTAATQIVPARRWRRDLAEAICEALGGIQACVMTCPPGDWSALQHTSTDPICEAAMTGVVVPSGRISSMVALPGAGRRRLMT